MIVKCDTCGEVGALLCERVDPRTFHVERARLCRRCTKRSGYVRVTFLRGPAISALGIRWNTGNGARVA